MNYKHPYEYGHIGREIITKSLYHSLEDYDYKPVKFFDSMIEGFYFRRHHLDSDNRRCIKIELQAVLGILKKEWMVYYSYDIKKFLIKHGNQFPAIELELMSLTHFDFVRVKERED